MFQRTSFRVAFEQQAVYSADRKLQAVLAEGSRSRRFPPSPPVFPNRPLLFAALCQDVRLDNRVIDLRTASSQMQFSGQEMIGIGLQSRGTSRMASPNSLPIQPCMWYSYGIVVKHGLVSVIIWLPREMM